MSCLNLLLTLMYFYVGFVVELVFGVVFNFEFAVDVVLGSVFDLVLFFLIMFYGF